MTYLAKPKLHHPNLPNNQLGFTHRDYEGSVSTLCAGCGHDSISAAIIQACFELDLPPHRIAKLSGIGCSSKTPTYFLGNSHGFNSVHGRMPSVLTGANLANRDLIYLGVSGDGDSASIGLGQFAHSMRRGVNMVYIVENNGVYGLTKGQFSATADKGSKAKRGTVNSDEPIDMVMLAMQLGASFVARKSYDFVRDHNEAVNRLDFMPMRPEITATYAPGSVQEVAQHDGTVLRLRKLHEDYDAGDRITAMNYLQQRHSAGEIVTGLLYLNADADDLHAALNTVDTPLNELRDDDLVPGSAALTKFNASLR
jgi:2-oxoglutarate ferredoxin oxidoreductase subunit beta